MKSAFRVLVVSFVLLSHAQAGVIVALGVQDALLASDAAKTFREELAAQTASAERSVLDLESQARELRTKIQTNQDLMSRDELNALQLQFQKTFDEYQRQGQALQQNRAEQEQRFISDMRPKLDQIIRKLIEERDISLIVNRQSTIYMEPGIDITPEVLKRLNEE